jgi:uncharacterized protein YidB (DUF937 family)
MNMGLLDQVLRGGLGSVSAEEARMGLSQLLPEMVDRLTPDGQLPDDERLDHDVAEFERQLRA